MNPPPATAAPRDVSGVEFEAVYRANVPDINALFARRCAEPQSVADLTSETFVPAIGSLRSFDPKPIGSLRSFDPKRGSARGWLFEIARLFYARHCERAANGTRVIAALSAHRELDHDEIEELAACIDDHRAGRDLLARIAGYPSESARPRARRPRGHLTPSEPARALDTSPAALRVRLFRAGGAPSGPRGRAPPPARSPRPF